MGARRKPDRRADPGIGRHDDPGDAELLGQPRGMQRRRAAEGDQAVLGDDLAALHRMDARRIGHVLVDDLAPRHSPPASAVSDERCADVRRNAAAALAPSSGSRPPAKRAGSMRPSTRSASVTVGCGAAAAVAGGPRLGARALRPHRDAAHGIDMGERAAAGADLHHLDHGDAQGQAAAPHEARGAVDLEAARGLGLADRRSGRSWPWCRPCRRRAPCSRRIPPRRSWRGWRRPRGRSPPGGWESARAVSSVVRPPPEVMR